MKQILILIISIFTLSLNGQVELKNKKSENTLLKAPSKKIKTENDSIPSVIFVKTHDNGRQPAYYINGKHAEINTRGIDPQLVESITVAKEDIEIEGIKYSGKLYIEMKEAYSPNLISLTDLKLKYAPLITKPTIFMIDSDIVKSDYSKYIVDEKYILQIVVEEIENKEENLDIVIIRLVTKTEENIKKSKEIWIRGTEEAMLN